MSKEELYPGSQFRMTGEIQEAYIRQLLRTANGPETTIAWQGGEPTLIGLEFFRRSIELERRYQKPGMRIQNTIQTNGLLLDDEWCEFFRQNGFLIGLSLDGPRAMHDAYRVDKGGQGTFDRVMRAVRLLQKHSVDFNILAAVHAANAHRPLKVYRFFRDQVRTQFIQFIPIVERAKEFGCRAQEGECVSDWSVKPRQWGQFLIDIFEEWIRRDVGRVFVGIFDSVLASWLGAGPGICIFAETCGRSVALEHNGDLYSCDHFVSPQHLLGNIQHESIAELVHSEKQAEFGRQKRDGLPLYCQECEVRFACHGECPKNRFAFAPDGEPGLNYLCAGYKAFFHHIETPMRIMAELLRRNRPAAEIVKWYPTRYVGRTGIITGAHRNDPCPCGSGRKYKRCHGFV